MATSLDSFVYQFNQALDEEIKQAKHKHTAPVIAVGGIYLGKKSEYLYVFTCDSEVRILDGSPIEVEYRGKRHEGHLVSSHGFDLVIGVDEHLGDSLDEIRLYARPWFLLEQLQLRLGAIPTLGSDARNPVLLRMLRGHDAMGVTRQPAHANRWLPPNTLNPLQNKSLTTILGQDLSFIWGPPGTGKTRTLGVVAATLLQQGESVLIAAHSNTAVDVATLNTALHLTDQAIYLDGKCIRAGIPILSEVNNYEMLSSRTIMAQRQPKLIQELESLEKQKATLHKQLSQAKLTLTEKDAIPDQLNQIKQQRNQILELIRAAEKVLLTDAKLVIATLSKAAIDDSIYARTFDNVILDEASMASIPQAAFLASLATKRVAIFGDFKQLPPISLAETPKAVQWLSTDIFQHARIAEAVAQGREDRRLVMLREQYRMHPDISQIINQLSYYKRLTNTVEVVNNQGFIASIAPSSQKAVLTIDTSNLNAFCFSEAFGGSRFNILTALMCVALAREAIRSSGKPHPDGQNPVAIITPYNAQARLINRLLRDTKLSQQVRVATVHKYQGSECDMVIFDAVEAPQKRPGKLSTGDMESTTARLMNVAVSRAKSKFIAIGHLDYLHQNLPDSAMTITFDLMSSKGTYTKMDWQSCVNLISALGTVFPTRRIADQSLVNALEKATEEIAIVWPQALSQQSFQVHMLKMRAASGTRVYVAAPQPDNQQHPVSAIVFLKAKSNIRSGLVAIDRKSLWLFTDPNDPNAGAIHIQHTEMIKTLYGLIELVPPNTIKIPIQTPEILADNGLYGNCPNCKSPLTHADNEYGGLSVCCSNPACNHRRRFLPNDATVLARLTGKVCEKCGGPVEGKQSSSVFVGCANFPTCTWKRRLSWLQ
ncbi:MAG: AAA family ATPase [Chloroflexi bacterium]|nr:AAA family ATPase [Chloroflexota bacterium]